MQRYVPDAPRTSLMGRAVRTLLLLVVIAVLAWHIAEGWSIATWIGEDYLTATAPSPVADAAIIGIEADRVTLRQLATADLDVATPGVFGFATEDFYLRLGEVVSYGQTDVTRTYETVEGAQPVIGEFGHLDLMARPWSALESVGLYEATYTGPLGEMDQLAIDGSGTWVIHVHDHLAGPDQAVPLMAALAATGVSQRSITYRNDPGQPSDAGGRFTFGVEERDDLEAAVASARASGAERVFLVGYGTGGAVVMAQVYRDLDITGAILDSPAIDAENAVDVAVSTGRTGLLGITAGTATKLGSVLAAVRYDVDWQTANYLSRAGQLGVPVLVIHAVDDVDHPVADSRALALEKPERVRLIEIEDAGTGLAWNTDPALYESSVLEFVDGLVVP